MELGGKHVLAPVKFVHHPKRILHIYWPSSTSNKALLYYITTHLPISLYYLLHNTFGQSGQGPSGYVHRTILNDIIVKEDLFKKKLYLKNEDVFIYGSMAPIMWVTPIMLV